ncbi:MAG: hypothetical protein AAF378_24605 [Cyanobacteria bacterium P01_A01_bin.84]
MQNDKLYFKGQLLTEETLLATDKYFADLNDQCIKEAKDGTTYVNDLKEYIAWCEDKKQKSLSGNSRNNFTYLQQAYYLQTGECIAFLPKGTIN